MRFIYTLFILTLPMMVMSQSPTPEQIKEVADAKKEVRRMKGEPFPVFELTTLDGETITSKDTKGKILMINFWFTGCRPCVMEMPEMNELVNEFQGEDIIFLAPTFDSKERVSRFLQKRNFQYQTVPDVKDFCIETNVRSFPTHFVINQEGAVEKVFIGYSATTVKSLRKSIHKLLNAK